MACGGVMAAKAPAKAKLKMFSRPHVSDDVWFCSGALYILLLRRNREGMSSSLNKLEFFSHSNQNQGVSMSKAGRKK
jgi:hypothetical protein